MTTPLQYVTTDRLTGQDLAQAINTLMEHTAINDAAIERHTSVLKEHQEVVNANAASLRGLATHASRGQAIDFGVLIVLILVVGLLGIAWIHRLQKRIAALEAISSPQPRDTGSRSAPSCS